MKPQKRKKKQQQQQTTTMAAEIPSDIDRFGLARRALPTQPPPPLSRLSLNGNASVLLSMADINSRMMAHSPHSSKSNDAIHSQDNSFITSSTRAASSHHFNIDELYVKSQPMIRRNMGKQGSERACERETVVLSVASQHTRRHTTAPWNPICWNSVHITITLWIICIESIPMKLRSY